MSYEDKHHKFHQKLDVVFALALFNFQIWLAFILAHYISGVNNLLLNFILLIFNMSMLIYWSKHRIPDKPFNVILYRISVLPFFAILASALLYFCLLPLTIILFIFFKSHIIPHIVVMSISAILGIYATMFTPFFPRKKTLIIKDSSIPKAFNNYKIIHISDLHFGHLLPESVYLRWEKLINDTQADLIIMSGDFITFGDHYVPRFINFIKALQIHDGILLSTGNHEAFTDLDALIVKLNATNAILLDNSTYNITRLNTSISIAAIPGVVDNLKRNINDLDAIIHKTKSSPDILIAHDANIFQYAATKGVKLCLSGHTHGGQISVPFAPQLNIVAFRYPYSSGYYKYNHSHLNVSNGLGIVHLPMRLGVPPEISVICLHSD